MSAESIEFEDERPLFEIDRIARARRPLPFSPHHTTPARPTPKIPPLKETLGRRHVKALHSSPIPRGTDISVPIDGLKRTGSGSTPQQERLFGIMEATREDGRPLHRKVAVEMPRRTGKTSGLFAVVIGRCAAREDYHVAYSAQTGAKGRKRFLQVAQQLERWDPDPDNERYRIFRSNGGEKIEWANGSSLTVLPPDPENYRGDEYDLVILDEAQEVPAESADELLGGVNPTMDTRPAAQLVIAGTAGKTRAGLLWDALEAGRAGKCGILEYAAPDTADPTLETTWLGAHPGIGTLTTLDVIRERFEGMSLPEFQREYVGQWPPDAESSAIDPNSWKNAKVTMPAQPTRVALAFDCEPSGAAAALCAAWRDDDGHAYIEVIAYRSSVTWLAREAHRVARDRRAPLAYDVVGANINVADAIHRLRPPVRLEALRVGDVQGAEQRVVSELADGTIHHFGQKDLDLAAAGANWRNLESGRLFGRKVSSADISPIVAGCLALWAFDRAPARRARSRVITPTAA